MENSRARPKPRPRRLAALAAVLACLLLAPAAFAEAAPKIALRLDYQPPAGADCPSAEALALMLAGEFGYTVVRSDVSPVVHVEIKRSRKGLAAEITGPNPTGSAEAWHGKTDPRGTCGELAYDIAYTVKLGLGPSAWGSEEPPPTLTAPADLDVARPWLAPTTLRLPDSLALVAPRLFASASPSTERTVRPFDVQLALGAVVTPFGLPGVALGGNFWVDLRWAMLAIAAEFRGATTLSAGIGDTELPGRTTILTGSLLPCLVVPHVDVCGLVNYSQMLFDFGKSYAVAGSDADSVGLGLRLAGRIPLSRRFALLPYGEASMQLQTINIQVASDDAPATTPSSWRSPRVRLTFGIAVAASLLE